MDQERLIAKWLKDDLSAEEQKEFEQLEDFDLNTKIIEGAKQFKAGHFSKAHSYEAFKANLVNSKPATKVIQLSTYGVFLRIAAVVVLALGVYFYLF